MRILGISGSLRRDSYNTGLLRTAVQLAPVDVELWDGLKAVPPYDADDEADPAPAVVVLRAALAGADGFLLAPPEYHHTVPGHLKNALAWASRPLATNPIRNKPAAVVGASTGAFGAVWAQAELRKVLSAIGARVLEEDLPVGLAATRFDEDGLLADDELRERLRALVDHLVASVDDRLATAA